MLFRATPIELGDEEHDESRQMSLSRTLAAGDAFGRTLILMLAQGRSYARIRKAWHTTAPTISVWNDRLLEDRIVWSRRGIPGASRW